MNKYRTNHMGWDLKYEDIKENRTQVRRYTRADWAWDWIGDIGNYLISPVRAVFRKALR